MVEASFNQDGFYRAGSDGICRPVTPVQHCDEEYDQTDIDTLKVICYQH